MYDNWEGGAASVKGDGVESGVTGLMLEWDIYFMCIDTIDWRHRSLD